MAARVALVHDWLTNAAGGEQVLWQLHLLYPEAPIYTSVFAADKLPQFAALDVRTSWLQNWPLSRSKHHLYSALRTRAFESFDFSSYDLVISTSSSEAKGIITNPGTVHISYVFTPTRYYWSNYHEYLANPGFGLLNPIVKWFGPGIISKQRDWDYAAAQRADYIIGISKYVNERIAKYYRRKADLIYPPVELSRFDYSQPREDFYLVVSRLVPYKQIELAILACNRLKRKLVIAGDGSERSKLERLAGPTISFVGRASNEKVDRLYATARGFIFTPEEDFGITPLEAMASGCPVIAYGRGGALETVVDGKTGAFYNEQTVDSLVAAMKHFEAINFDPKVLRKQADKFSDQKFRSQFAAYVKKVT